jgi:hypothetical protein
MIRGSSACQNGVMAAGYVAWGGPATQSYPEMTSSQTDQTTLPSRRANTLDHTLGRRSVPPSSSHPRLDPRAMFLGHRGYLVKAAEPVLPSRAGQANRSPNGTDAAVHQPLGAVYGPHRSTRWLYYPHRLTPGASVALTISNRLGGMSLRHRRVVAAETTAPRIQPIVLSSPRSHPDARSAAFGNLIAATSWG